MRRQSRFLAGLLSLAMVVANFSVPVTAAELTEDDARIETAVEAEEVSEAVEISGCEEDVIAEEDVITDEVVSEEVGGAETFAEDEEDTEEKTEEDINGMIGDPANDTLIYVRSTSELKRAIEAAKSGEVVTILALDPYDMENDEDYTISSNEVITIPGGKTIEIQVMTERFLSFDNDELKELAAKEADIKDYPSASIVVESGAKFGICSAGQEDVETRINIVNKGTLLVGTLNKKLAVVPFKGAAITNESGATARLTGGDFYSSDGESAVIVNNGTMVMDDIIVSAGETGALGGDRFAVVNKGDLIVEDCFILEGETYEETKDDETAYRYCYGILNDKEASKLTVRGAALISSIYNNSTLSVGTENDEMFFDTYVGEIYAFNDSNTVIHTANVELVDMVTDRAKKSVFTSGNVTLVGGEIEELYFGNVLPILTTGKVTDLRHEIYDEEAKAVITDPDPTTLYFRGYSAEGPKLLEKKPAFRVYDEKKDDSSNWEYKGTKYVVAEYITNGVPYYHGAILDMDKTPYQVKRFIDGEYYPISSLDDLKRAAVSDNSAVYYLTDDIEVTEPVTFTCPEVVILDGLYDEETYEYVLDDEGNPIRGDFIFTGTGSFTIEENSYAEIHAVLIATSEKEAVTNSLLTNKGTVLIDEIEAAYTTKPLVENFGSFASFGDISAYQAQATMLVNTEKGTAVIAEDIYNAEAKASMIDNSGNMLLYTEEEDPYINILVQEPFTDENDEDVKGVTAVKNSGVLYVQDVSVENLVEDSLVVDNQGTLEINEGNEEAEYAPATSTIEGSAKGTTAVLNNGAKASFVMNGGSVNAYKYDTDDEQDKASSYAIVYTDNEPVITRGTVNGSRSDLNHVLHKFDEEGNITDETESAVCGSAVVKKDGTTGYFKDTNAEGATAIDSRNAGVIKDGEIPYRTKVRVNERYAYLLMEKGESVLYTRNRDLNEGYAFILTLEKNTFGVPEEDMFEYRSTDPAVAVVKEVTAAQYDPENYNDDSNKDLMDTKVKVIEAVGTGMATIKVRSRLSGNEDYLVIESVAKGMREQIVAESYDVNLATPDITVNAYQKQTSVKVDWRIKDYEKVTGAYDLANNFYPEYVYVTGSDQATSVDFAKYFSYDVMLRKDGTTKTYDLDLYTIPTQNMDSTYLAQDEMSGLEGLNVTLVVKNVVSRKTLEIRANQKLNIKVDQKAPAVKLSKATVNSAYTEGFDPARVALSDHVIEPEVWGEISEVGLPAATRDFTYVGGDMIGYTGPAKGGSYKIPVQVRLQDYYGTYDTTLNVRAKAVFPKVSLDKKKVTVIPEAGDYSNIFLTLQGNKKTGYDIGYIDDIRVINGYRSKFEVGEVGFGWFTLVPREKVEKNEKLTIAVSYYGIKKNKGKTHTTLLKLNVKALDPSKLKVKAIKDAISPLYAKQEELPEGSSSAPAMETLSPGFIAWESAGVDVDLTNIYYVVTSLDGKSYVTSSDTYDENTYFDGVSPYNVAYVYATDKLTPKDKYVSVQVSMYDASNTQLGKSTVVKIPVNSGECTVNPLKSVNIDLTKQFTFNTSPLTKAKGYIRSVIAPDTESFNEGFYPKAIGENRALNYELDVFAYNSTALKVANGTILRAVDYKGSPFFNIITDANKLYVITNHDALAAGLIKPGCSYTMDLLFESPGGNQIVPLVVNIADIKSAKVTGVAFDDLSAMTSYARARIGIRTEVPYYGLRIKEVTCDSPEFEISAFTDYEPGNESDELTLASQYIDEGSSTETDGSEVARPNSGYADGEDYNYFFLTWKDNKPSAVKNGVVKVNLTVTYTCGLQAKVAVPVNVYGVITK